MKYIIEFNLPDNKTIKEELQGSYVSWSIWGYSGIAKAKPVAEPKKGRWDVEHGVFMHDDIYGDIYRCSVCGYRERNPEGFNYCPHCGTKMEVDE